MAGIQLAPFVLAILVVLGNAADTVDSTDNKAPGYFGDDRDDLNGASFFFLLLIALGPIVIMWCIWKVKRVRSERWRNLYVNDQAEIRRRATEQLVVARHAQDLRDRERQRQNGGDENTGSGVGIPFEWYHDQELRMHSHVVDCLFPEHKSESQGGMEGSASNTISSRDDEITRKQSELGTEKDSSIDVLSEEATVKSDDDQANETTCPVCLEQIGVNETGVFGTSCNHVFHRHCILEWLKVNTMNDSCPNCRQPMWDPETYRLLNAQVMLRSLRSEASIDGTGAAGDGHEESGARDEEIIV